MINDNLKTSFFEWAMLWFADLFPVSELGLDEVKGAAEILVNNKDSSIIIILAKVVRHAKNCN